INCANCRLMEASVLSRPDVAEVLGRFVTVQLYTPPNVPIDSIPRAAREALSERNAERQLDLTNEPTNPLYVILAPDAKVVGVRGGYNEPPVFLDFLNRSLSKVKGSGKVAQADAGR